MLVLSRKTNEKLIIGDNIVVTIVRVAGGSVRLGVEAPEEVSIRREELVAASAGQQPTPRAGAVRRPIG